MKNTILGLLSFGLLLFTIPLSAQDMETDLKAVQAHYQSMNSYHLKMTATVYNWDNLEEPAGTQISQIKKNGEEVICEMDQMLLLMTKDYLITRLKKESVLVCNKRETSTNTQPMLPDFDQVLSTYDELVFKGYTKGLKCYVLKKENSPTPVIELYLNEKSSLLERMVYHYDEAVPGVPAKADIQVEHLALNPNFSKRLFSPGRYVQIDQNVVRLRPSYQDYTLILGEGLEYE